jgi:hypothetical protein
MGLQYGIKEVLDLNILDFKTKEPIVFIDYATATTNENAGERLDLNGGRGNARQMSFDHSKTSTFTLNVPMVDLNLLSILTGEDVKTGSEIGNLFMREVLTVKRGQGENTDLQITLSKAPVGEVKVYELKGLRDNGEKIEVNVSDKNVILSSQVVSAGDEVVAFYQYEAPATAKKVSVKSTKFPKAVEIFGVGLARNQEDEQDYPCHVHVFKARPQPNFTFTMSGTEATNLELTFDLYEVKDKNGDGQYIDYIFETE